MTLHNCTDQLGREIQFQFPPQRIISLVPSITELLCDLGLEEKVIGVTKFCVHPSNIRTSKKIIGGTKNLHINEIIQLNPDLIIANKEENERSQIEELSKQVPVWISDVKNFEDALVMIRLLGDITGKSEKASEVINMILKAKTNLEARAVKDLSVLYLIWKDPYMSVGNDTFIHSMIELAGFKNVCAAKVRYPEIKNEEIQSLNPDLIFLSSEPYPFKQKHIAELNSICPNARVVLVDGEIFSWYGSRMKNLVSIKTMVN